MTDEEFAENLMEGLARIERKDLLARLKALDDDKSPMSEKKSSQVWFRWALLSLVILLLALTIWWFTRSSNSPPDYFEPFDPIALVNLSTTEEQITSLRATAKQQYEAGAYRAASASFQQLIVLDKSPILLFYKGISDLGANKPEQAISTLRQFKPNAGTFSDATDWYLALALKESGALSEAKQILEQLIAKDSGYKTQAQEVLQNI